MSFHMAAAPKASAQTAARVEVKCDTTSCHWHDAAHPHRGELCCTKLRCSEAYNPMQLLAFRRAVHRIGLAASDRRQLVKNRIQVRFSFVASPNAPKCR